MDHFPWLSVVTFIPAVGGVMAMAIPSRARGVHRWWALAVTLVTFGFALGLLGAYDGGQPGFQLVDRATWVGPLNFKYLLGVDGISLWLVILTTFLMPAGVLISWGIENQVKYFMVAFLVLETAMIGSFLALDLLLFFFFFEALLFPMYLFFVAGSQLGHVSFDYAELVRLHLPVATGRWLFLAFFVAFAVKTPLVPFHTWLPDAHTEAPTAGALALAAVVIKVGVYGLIRFNMGLFPEASSYFRTTILVLAVIGIV